MELNYQHLQYFWVVVKEGSVAAASRSLGVTSATISAQLKQLERSSGQRLLQRSGKSLVPTERGLATFRYAERIFGVGQELLEFLRGKSGHSPERLDVGSAPVLPKLVTWSFLNPVFREPEHCRVYCGEASNEKLVQQLLQHQLDVVLSDTPLGEHEAVRVFNHRLGESAIAFVAAPQLARSLRRGFPRSFNDQPVLLPSNGTAIRRSVDEWFDTHDIRPRIVAEFEDNALLKVAGADGFGAFPIAEFVLDIAQERYGVELIGRASGISERFYAVSIEREIAHPLVQLVTREARNVLGHREEA